MRHLSGLLCSASLVAGIEPAHQRKTLKCRDADDVGQVHHGIKLGLVRRTTQGFQNTWHEFAS